MFQYKVAVQQDSLNLRQYAVVAVQVSPPRLHHADLRLGKVVNHFHQPIGRRHKVRVEDRHKLALRHFESRIQCPGFVSVTIGTVNIGNRMAQRRIPLHNPRGHLLRLIC